MAPTRSATASAAVPFSSAAVRTSAVRPEGMSRAGPGPGARASVNLRAVGVSAPGTVAEAQSTTARTAACRTGVGATVDVLDGPAAERRLLRSVFRKGWAAAVVEALDRPGPRTARSGCGRSSPRAQPRGRRDPDRLVDSSHRHAVRRTVVEMRVAPDMLDDLGVPPLIATAGGDLLRRLPRLNSVPE